MRSEVKAIGLLVDALRCYFCARTPGPFWAVVLGDEVVGVCSRCLELELGT